MVGFNFHQTTIANRPKTMKERAQEGRQNAISKTLE
jgi:hypothetical protein